jgi:NADH-quinone oxidoreductase subunit N
MSAAMNYMAAAPEILLLAAALLIAMVDLWVTDPARRVTYYLTQLTLLAYSAMHLVAFNASETQLALQGMFSADPMTHLLCAVSGLAIAAVLLLSRPYAQAREILKGELFTLSLFMLLGVAIMCGATHFLVVYLGLELMSLSLYALVALRRDHAVSTEAAMKYFVLGALASGFLLYGLSMIYGATGSLSIPQVYATVAAGSLNPGVLVFGLIFVVAGLAFKLGAAPFHMWVPDVYQGAPTAVTLLIGTAPKLAAFAITIRLLVEGLLSLAFDWQQMLLVLSVFSLIVGNLVAIAQTNIKRMLAYSTIAQMGFMLLGLASGVVYVDGVGSAIPALNAYSSSLFYAVTYVMTTIGSFAMVMLLARQGHEAEQLSDFAGLWQRSPWYAAVMALLMLSLAGIPPTVGFYAKLAVLQALIATQLPLYIGIAVVAVLLSLIGAFYYLRVIKVMFFDAPAERAALQAPADVRALLSLNGVAVLALGVLPGGLMAWCTQAIVRTLS